MAKPPILKATHMVKSDPESFARFIAGDNSGLLHAAHTAWNALAVLELKLRAQTDGDHERE